MPFVHLESSRGASLQRNCGLNRCTGEVVVFLDDDVALDDDALAALERAYDNPDVVGATGRVSQLRQHRVDRDSSLRGLLPGGGTQGTFTRYGYPRYLMDLDQPRDVQFMMGCFMSARRDDAVAVRFDEWLTGSSIAEDEDFSWRLSARGRIAYVPEARCRHKLADSFDGERASARMTVVNRAYLFRKNFRATPLARLQFSLLVGFMLVHKLVNLSWASAAGIVEGAAAVARGEHRKAAGRRLAVAFVGSHARSGGSERYLENVIAHVDADVRFVTILEEGPAAASLRNTGVQVDVIPTGPRGPDVVGSAFRLRRTMRRAQPDVVHANGVKAALVSVLATRATGIPVVWLKHDHSFDGNTGLRIARRCAIVVGVSRSVVASLDGLPAGKVRVVTTGTPVVDVDRDEARAALVAELAGDGAMRLVGLVGRLNPEKGAEELLAIVPELVDRRPGTRIVLVGGDDPAAPGFRARLERAAADLGGNVTLLGQRDDAPRVIAGLDLLVVPSVSGVGAQAEGFPLVAVEALQAGTPVVAYATGGLPELLGDCGVLVPPGDRTALLAAVDDLLGDPARRRQLSERGRARARERYDVDRMTGELVACYREAAGR